jgi:hypothetical protein
LLIRKGPRASNFDSELITLWAQKTLPEVVEPLDATKVVTGRVSTKTKIPEVLFEQDEVILTPPRDTRRFSKDLKQLFSIKILLKRLLLWLYPVRGVSDV